MSRRKQIIFLSHDISLLAFIIVFLYFDKRARLRYANTFTLMKGLGGRYANFAAT